MSCPVPYRLYPSNTGGHHSSAVQRLGCGTLRRPGLAVLTRNSDTLQLWPVLGWFRITPIVSLSRLTGLALAVAIGWIPLAAPVHVHAGGDHAGHHRATIHRHPEAHGGSHHHAAKHHGVFEQSDAQVRTISSLFVIRDAPPGPGAPPAEAAPPFEVPVVPVLHPVADHVELLIHGPPRIPGLLRGPPLSPAL
jgi:hypothetical protein